LLRSFNFLLLKRRPSSSPCRRGWAGDRWQRQRLGRGGRGTQKNMRINPMHLPMHQASRCRAKSKRSGKPCRSPAVRGSSVCRMHGAGGGAPRGNRNALSMGLHRRDDRPEKRNSGPRSDGPRDDGRDRIEQCGTAHARSASPFNPRAAATRVSNARPPARRHVVVEEGLSVGLPLGERPEPQPRMRR